MTDRGESWPKAAGIELVQDLSRLSSPIEGYLRRHRHRVKTVFDDGTRSDVYVADYMDRDPSRRDAVAIAVFARAANVQGTEVLLRRQMRYGAYVRSQRPLTTEVLAGLLEDNEAPESTVVREVYEEAGIEVAAERVITLGRPFYILPGIFTEIVLPRAVEVTRERLQAATLELPPGDGSPFEEGADLVRLTLAEIFDRIEAEPQPDPRALIIDDAKTELLLARLWRHIEGGG